MGRLKLPSDAGSGIAVALRLEDIFLELEAEGEELGRWRVDDVEIERLYSNQFRLDLAGEDMVFVADDALGFAYEGVTAIDELSERLRRKNRWNPFRRSSRSTSEPSRPAAKYARTEPQEAPDTEEAEQPQPAEPEPPTPVIAETPPPVPELAPEKTPEVESPSEPAPEEPAAVEEPARWDDKVTEEAEAFVPEVETIDLRGLSQTSPEEPEEAQAEETPGIEDRTEAEPEPEPEPEAEASPTEPEAQPEVEAASEPRIELEEEPEPTGVRAEAQPEPEAEPEEVEPSVADRVAEPQASVPNGHRERRWTDLFRFGKGEKVPEHDHDYQQSKTVGGITRRVCSICGHVSFVGEDVYEGWS